MSHYAVVVFTDDERCSVDDLLEPYDEHIKVPHYIKKSEIIAGVRADIESYKNSFYAKYLSNPDEYIKSTTNKEHIDYISKEFPKRLSWTDEECYRYGIKYYDEENICPNGDVFSLYSPNAKWDWYEIGGRFNSTIPLTDGSFADEASMDCVDINYRDSHIYNKSYRRWELIVDDKPCETPDDASLKESTLYSKKYLERLYKDADDYASWCSSFSFYAAVKPNGEWLEPGKMGWWGISDVSDDDNKAWRKTVRDILKEAKENHWNITMVDCHI